jgi:hypothetical protein
MTAFEEARGSRVAVGAEGVTDGKADGAGLDEAKARLGLGLGATLPSAIGGAEDEVAVAGVRPTPRSNAIAATPSTASTAVMKGTTIGERGWVFMAPRRRSGGRGMLRHPGCQFADT